MLLQPKGLYLFSETLDKKKKYEKIAETTQIVTITFQHVLWKKSKFYIEDPEKFTEFYKSNGDRLLAELVFEALDQIILTNLN